MSCLIVGQRAPVREHLCKLLCNQNFNALPCRSTPFTTVNYGESYGSSVRRLAKPVTTSAFTGTDRGLLRSVLGPWSPVPKCEAPGEPISVEERTSIAPRPHSQSQNPPLQKSFAIPALPWDSKLRLRYSPVFAPTTRLKALLNAASDS